MFTVPAYMYYLVKNNDKKYLLMFCSILVLKTKKKTKQLPLPFAGIDFLNTLFVHKKFLICNSTALYLIKFGILLNITIFRLCLLNELGMLIKG